jgi:F5/8 type C domain-containing protein
VRDAIAELNLFIRSTKLFFYSVAFVLLADATARAETIRILDNFTGISSWQAQHTDDVSAVLHNVDGNAMRLDFDFRDAAGNPINGYATARRVLPLDLPENYEISFRVRGDAPVNAFQFKLVDASGENVWWWNRPDFEFSHDWQQIKIKKRQIDFAWGPIKDRELKHSAAIEFVVSSGRDGGKGSVTIDDLTIRTLPPPSKTQPVPLASASSSAGASPQHVLDEHAEVTWCSGSGKNKEQYFDVDFREPREFGGLTLDWQDGKQATHYDVQFSDDGKTWRTVRSVHDGDGGSDALYLPESETRHVRLALHDGPALNYCLSHLNVESLAWSATPSVFFQGLAKKSPRGNYPRGFSEQPYWTIVGIDGGPTPALLSEDGAIEPGKGSFSIEPFLLTDDGLKSWANVGSEQSLVDNYLPIPSVLWKTVNAELSVEAFAQGTREQSQVIARYRVNNTSAQEKTLTLALAIRPFQVNPPAQFLNSPGGVSPIHDLAFEHDAVIVNGIARVKALRAPDRFVASTFDAGQVPALLTHPTLSNTTSVHDDFGYASGALLYRLQLQAHASTEIVLVALMTGEIPSLKIEDASNLYQGQKLATAAAWREKLNRVTLQLPSSARKIADVLRTAQAHILMTRDGASLRPGTRSYARSWIRDGAMMADALLRLGDTESVRAYVDWYAPHQFANGKVPCCVDHRGSDPVPENDSHGELIHVISALYRYTGDRKELEKNWPYVEAAIRYMDTLRAKETGESDPAFKGMMPASISHEGYSAKPMHSYWDDFWAMTGYKDAAAMAMVIGAEQAQRMDRERDAFAHDLYASIDASTKAHAIDYLPGSAELGDFDPTSSTVALSPAGEQANLPSRLLQGTFERYWHEFVARRDGMKSWNDYTPYELRNIDAFVRLGWRDRAKELLDFFFSTGLRPAAWNQWAEVVGHELRQPRFVGDMPHGWVASDFIRSVLDMFAYERDADHAFVLAAGVPVGWLKENGIAIGDLRTPYGKLRYTLRQDGKKVFLHIAAGISPPGGFVFSWPFEGVPSQTRVNGKPTTWANSQLHIAVAPADIVIEAAGELAPH